MRDDLTRWLRWGLVVASAVLLAPLAPAVMLALWASSLAGGIHRPLTKWLGGRSHLAAVLAVVALVMIVVPFALVLASLAADAYQLVVQLAGSPRGKALLEQLVAKGPGDASPSSVWELILSQQERAWGIVQQITGTATRAVISIVVIIAGTYFLLIDGERWYRWVEAHAPISPSLLGRLRDAFYETGRGLFVGIGGAGLLQAIVATVAYFVLGVPRSLELGLLTLCFSVIPAVGTALVWVPVAAGLALTDRTGAAIALAICGVAVIGTVDNIARPLLTRRGRLQLPTFVVLISMLGGVQVIGAWGVLVGPLVVRLAKAALESPEPATP